MDGGCLDSPDSIVNACLGFVVGIQNLLSEMST